MNIGLKPTKRKGLDEKISKLKICAFYIVKAQQEVEKMLGGNIFLPEVDFEPEQVSEINTKEQSEKKINVDAHILYTHPLLSNRIRSNTGQFSLGMRTNKNSEDNPMLKTSSYYNGIWNSNNYEPKIENKGAIGNTIYKSWRNFTGMETPAHGVFIGIATPKNTM